MATAADRVVEWRGGSIDELVRMLAASALAARIQVFAREGATEQLVGEVHMLAGGVAEAVSGPVRSDEAMAELRAVTPPIRCLVEPAIPEPGTGRLVPSGPEEGKLGERSPAALMRYCEEYVMTCLLEVWRGGEHAAITYRKGEITASTVDGSDAPERLPEVMTWSTGHYRLVLPPLVLPTLTPTRRPTPLEQKTLFGYRRPEPPWPERDAAGVARNTTPLSSSSDGDAAMRRSTTPGMPIDVYDATAPERTTDIGVPSVEPPKPAPARTTSPPQGAPAASPSKPAPAPAAAKPAPAAPPAATTPATGKPLMGPPAALSRPTVIDGPGLRPAATAAAPAAAAAPSPSSAAPSAAAPSAPARTVIGMGVPQAAASAAATPPANASAAAAPAAAAAAAPSHKPAPKPTVVGFDRPQNAATIPGLARESRAVATAPRFPTKRIAVRRRSLSDLPVVAHVGLGLALGLSIVGAYWVIQSVLAP